MGLTIAANVEGMQRAGLSNPLRLFQAVSGEQGKKKLAICCGAPAGVYRLLPFRVLLSFSPCVWACKLIGWFGMCDGLCDQPMCLHAKGRA